MPNIPPGGSRQGRVFDFRQEEKYLPHGANEGGDQV
jgi:hypothetical protein